MTRHSLIIIIASVIGFLLPGTLKAQDAELVDVVQLYQDGQYQSARAKASAIAKQYPDYDAAYYYMGLCDLFLNNAELAQAELKTASTLDPKNYWYRDRLAVAYSATGDDDLTIDTYETILKDFPKQTDAYYALVNLYLKHNQLDKALEAMDNIETVAGKSEQITMTKYEIYLHQNKPEEAKKVLEDFNRDYSSAEVVSVLGDHVLAEYADSLALGYYQEALALDKSYAPALLGKAEVYRIRRDYPSYFETMREFVSNTDIDPRSKSQYLSALVQQADARFAQNFKKDLDDLYSTSLSLHNADSTLLQSAAVYYYRTDRKDAAMDVLERCADLYPSSLSSTATYLQVTALSEEWERLSEASDKAMERFPKEVGILQYKSSACYYLEDYKGVIDVSQKMIDMHPNDTSVTIPALSNIGDMYHQLGDAKSAYKIYDKVLKMRPDYVQVLNNYAYYLSVENKNLKKAYQMSKITVEKEPDNSTYLDTFGWILYLQGKALEAKPFFKHAMLYGGKESAVILDHYAEVLYALKEYDLAKVYWNQAKAKNTNGEIPDLDQRVQARLDAIK